MQKYCVFYLIDGRECRSPWFFSKDRAIVALRLMQSRYGATSAILFID